MSDSSSEHCTEEGELSGSPDHYKREKMDDDEVSLSLSEEDQNNDSLDIKPPQHQAGYCRHSKSRDRDGRGSGKDRNWKHRSSDWEARETRHLREEKREDSRKHDCDRRQDSRKEDLRERLERVRKRRITKTHKNNDRRDSHVRRRQEEKSRGKRGKREKRQMEYEEMESNFQVEHRERMKSREEMMPKRESPQLQIISSPESDDDLDMRDGRREEAKENNKEENASSSESSDEGEASTTTTIDAEENEASPYVRSSNGKHPLSDHEEEEDIELHPEKKRSKSDREEVMEEKEVTPPPSPVELKETLPPYLPAIMGCRSVEEFRYLNRIEEGTYGIVYRVRDKRNDEIVALKQLKMEREKEGFPITSLREVSTLLKAQHPNIVTVREIVVGSNMDKIFMVMDYVEHDLKSLMETMKTKKQFFVPGEVKCLLQQLLRAVAHLHDNWILHRDLKTSNLLLSHKGILKVGDFGLAREYGSPLKAYTSIVVTLWYRAPELLLGAKKYSTPIDVWSVGCIFGELLTMEAIFQGKSEGDQINKIFRELGTPNDKIWPGYSELPMIQKAMFTNNPVSHLRKRFATRLSELGLDLLQKFLTYDPAKRITAEDALKHTYLKEPPLPIDPSMFPTWPAKSEMHGPRKPHSPKPPSGGVAYKQFGDKNDDVLGPNTGFHMGTGNIDRRMGAVGAGFSLRF